MHCVYQGTYECVKIHHQRAINIAPATATIVVKVMIECVASAPLGVCDDDAGDVPEGDPYEPAPWPPDVVEFAQVMFEGMV